VQDLDTRGHRSRYPHGGRSRGASWGLTARVDDPAVLVGERHHPVFAGCLSAQSGTTDTPTDTCTAHEPPPPTDGATSPRSYPDRPSELTAETVEKFLTAYETAYQYNDALAANPNKIGRTNAITVRIQSVSVTSEPDGFTATVSGQFQSDIIDAEPSTTTPETPTETPLPMGHGPIEASYTVTERKLSRESTVRECW
jgi:hypothetical protein